MVTSPQDVKVFEHRISKPPPFRATNLPAVFHLVMQVWGPSYCRMFTDICLPALLSPGNIPALVAEWPARFIIYTRDLDVSRIKASPSYARLASLLPVDFKTVDEELHVNKYSALTQIHHRVLGLAQYERAAIVWLVPDAIWSDGSLRTVSRAAAAGKRAVMQPALRVVKERVLAHLTRRAGEPQFDGFPAGELVQLSLDHMHPYYRTCYWDTPQFNRNPALIFWRVGTEGVLARGFHLHPLMLFPSRQVRDFTSTFDDDLPLLACPDYRDFHIIEDSDDGFHIDLTEEDWCEEIPVRRGRGSAFFLSLFALRSTNLHHRRFVRHPVRIHAGDCSPAWDEVQRESGRTIAAMRVWIALAGVARLPLELAFGHLRAFYRSGKPVRWTNKVSTSKPLNALLWVRRRAYLSACGWVFGNTVACVRVGLDPWHERPVSHRWMEGWMEEFISFYWGRVYAPYVAPAYLGVIDLRSRWRKSKKRMMHRARKGLPRIRKIGKKTAKSLDRQVRMMGDRVGKVRLKVVKRTARAVRAVRGRHG